MKKITVRPIWAQMCRKRAQNDQKSGFRNFLKICLLDFSDFCMKLEGMVGHNMGPAAISRKFWFFHNGVILRAKITFVKILRTAWPSFLIFHQNVSNNKRNKYS